MRGPLTGGAPKDFYQIWLDARADLPRSSSPVDGEPHYDGPPSPGSLRACDLGRRVSRPPLNPQKKNSFRASPCPTNIQNIF